MAEDENGDAKQVEERPGAREIRRSASAHRRLIAWFGQLMRLVDDLVSTPAGSISFLRAEPLVRFTHAMRSLATFARSLLKTCSTRPPAPRRYPTALFRSSTSRVGLCSFSSRARPRGESSCFFMRSVWITRCGQVNWLR